MFGEHNSVSQLLKAEYPDVVTVKGPCHLIHLASSYAALKLPKGLEGLCRVIFAHFHRSSKRQYASKELQQFFNGELHLMLSSGQTRIDPTFGASQQPLNGIYVGMPTTATLQEIKEIVSEDDVDVQNFRINCRNFFIKSIHQLQQRFDLNSKIYQVIECISPSKAAARFPLSLTELSRNCHT